MSDPFALVANCATHTHDPSRTSRLDPADPSIPYDWAVRHS
jgi:dTDP-4-dehydrorhamnose 3,5-epimerase